MPRVAVQVVLYYASRDLPAFLESLKNQTFQDWELFAYENSCDKQEAENARTVLSQSGIPFRLTTGDRNLGFSAHNILFRQSDTPFVMVVNHDLVLDPSYMDACLKRMDDQRAASVAGLVLRWDGRGIPAYDRATVDTAGLKYFCLADVRDRFAGRAIKDNKDAIHKSRQVFGVSGAVAFYRRSAVESVATGGELYDQTFFMYKEDVELAIRLNRKGYSTLYDPTAVAYHKRSVKDPGQGLIDRIKDERRRPKNFRMSSYRNQWRIYMYHWSWRLGFKETLCDVTHEFMRSLMTLLASPRVFARAWLEIMAGLPAAWRRRKALCKISRKSE